MYSPVAGTEAPAWEQNKYYSLASNTYTLTTEAPADWATTYANYYTLAYQKVNLAADANNNVGVAAQMYYTVKSYEALKTGDKVTGYKFVLEVQEFAPIS